MANVATLGAKAVFDVSNFMGGINRMNSGIGSVRSNIDSINSALGRSKMASSQTGDAMGSALSAGAIAGGVAAAAVVTLNTAMSTLYATANKLKDGFMWGQALAIEAEKSQMAFEVLFKSSRKAKNMMADLQDFALNSSFTMESATQNALLMRGMGIADADILPALNTLGDMAMGNQEKLAGLALAYGQVQAKGKLMAQEFNQFAERGINLRDSIAQNLNIPITEVAKAMEDGKVSAELFRNALVDLHSRDFAGMSKKYGETMGGTLDRIREKAGVIFKDIANYVNQAFDARGVLGGVEDALGRIHQMIREGMNLVASAREVTDAFLAFRDRPGILSPQQAMSAIGFAGRFSGFFGRGAQSIGSGLGMLGQSAGQYGDVVRQRMEFNKMVASIRVGGGPERAKNVMQALEKVPVPTPWLSKIGASLGSSMASGVKDALNTARISVTDGLRFGSGLFNQASQFINGMTPAKQPEYTPTGALVAGSSEAYSAQIRNMFGDSRAVTVEEKQLDEAKKMVSYLAKIAQAATSGATSAFNEIESFLMGES